MKYNDFPDSLFFYAFITHLYFNYCSRVQLANHFSNRHSQKYLQSSDLKAASISFVIQVAQRVARGKREKPTDKTDTADLLLVELNSAR